MFQKRKARNVHSLMTMSLAAMIFSLGGCTPTEEIDGEQRAAREALFEAPPGSPTEVSDEELQRRNAELAAMTEDEVKRQQAHNRQARERIRLLAASGPPTELQGALVSASTHQPETDCQVSISGQSTYSDERGIFVLPNVPSEGQVRLRIKCRGLIERHNVMVPGNVIQHTLPEPITIGRGFMADASSPELPPSRLEEFEEAVAVLDHLQPQRSAREQAKALEQNEELRPKTDDAASATEAAKPSSARGLLPTIPKEPEQFVSGSLNGADIAPELRRRAEALHSCYAEYLETHRDVVGAVRVRWVISATGVVEDVEVRQSTLNDPIQDECLARRISRLSFPASDDVTTVNQTFVFSFWLPPANQITQ